MISVAPAPAGAATSPSPAPPPADDLPPVPESPAVVVPAEAAEVSERTGPPIPTEPTEPTEPTDESKPSVKAEAPVEKLEIPESSFAVENWVADRPPSAAASPAADSLLTAAESLPAASLEGPPIESPGPSIVADPFAQFLVYDDETELVYDDEEDEPRAEGTMLPFDPAKVTFPRSLLYIQGVLLGVVTLVGFALGILVGGGTGSVAVVDEPVPCVISGRIALRTQGDNTIMDHGAVAMVFPQGSRPETKLEIVGLRPRDSEPPADHPALLAIRNLGGDYARADQDGAFRLHVPDRGKYFVLVISANRRSVDPEIPRSVLVEVGRFFQLAPDLFAGYDYRWQAETVRGDRQLNFVF
ncbi:MAG: hypothetical protein KJ000_30910 [Pirellulaceae bacterium]|nr:hypothetical protein [Pirellulaceae bacterium]